ncbi:MAG: hypothetical protein LC624_12550 [Halobacteriales archaeon]|nr:hypothetical protein [Halobacteriales archaeon]
MRLALVALALLLAGCAAPTEPAPGTGEPPPNPQQLVMLAMERLGTDLGSKGALSSLHGDIASEGERGTFDLQLGADDTDRIHIDLPPLNVTLWCHAGQGAVAFGNRTLLAGGSCADERGQVRANLTGEARSVVSVAPEGQGWVALVRETNETGEAHNATVHLDAQGRVARIRQEQEGGTMDIALTYGPRQAIALPEVKVPARVNHTTGFERGTLWWNVSEAQDRPALRQLEVRVSDTDANATRLATFPFGPAHQERAGFTLDVRDDGDGQLGPGDGFTLRNATWTQEWQVDVAVWDVPGGGPVGEDAVPGFDAALGLLAVLGALAFRKR